jgi:hypothetical protein
MSNGNYAVTFAKDFLGKVGKKKAFQNGLEEFIALKTALDTIIGRHEKLNEVFKEVKMPSAWLDCPTCDSPVLMEFGECPFCSTTLLDSEEEKPKKKAPAKKKAKPVAEEVEEEEDETEEVDEVAEDDIEFEDADDSDGEVDEDDSDEEGEEYSDDDDEEEEGEEIDWDNAPDEDEVKKMKKSELQETIDNFGLEVDLNEHKGIKAQREAVNEALDIAFEEANGGDEDEEGEEEEADINMGDDDEELDLDGINFEDIDDLEGMEDADDDDEE